jgi:tetratricopeptide (TPR) repeat protein
MSDFNELFEKALSAGRNRNYKKSLELFEKLVSASDEFPQAFLYMGRAAHGLKQYSSAAYYFKRYLRLEPQSLGGKFFLGRSYLALGSTGLALQNFLQVYDAKPDFPGIQPYLGLAYLKRKRFSLAVKFLGVAVENDPENQQLYVFYLNSLFLQAIRLFYNEDYELAAQMFRFLEAQDAPHLLLTLYLGMTERERGNYEEALSLFEKTLEKAPDDTLIRLQRAEMLFLLGDRQTARAEWEKLPFSDSPGTIPKDTTDFNRVTAVEHFQNGQYRKAFFHSVKVLKAESDPRMHLLAAEASRHLCDWERAYNHYQRALTIDKGLIEARYGLAILLWHQENYTEMISDLETILHQNPQDDLAPYYLALCLEKVEAPVDKVLPLVQEQIRKTGPDPYLFNALGNLYIRSDLPELSEKWYRKALALNSTFNDPYEGLFYLAQDFNLKEKIKLLEGYLENNPEDHFRRLNLAELCIEADKYKKAVPHLQRILPFLEDDKRIRRLLAYCHREAANFRAAASLYLEMLREEPKNSLFLRSLVYCLDRDGKRDFAINLLLKALKELKPSADHYLILGVLLHKEKRLDEALQQFRLASDLAGKDWRPIHNMSVVYEEKGMKDYAAEMRQKAEKMQEKR